MLGLAVASGTVSEILAFVLVLGLFIFMYRFLLIIPAFVMGRKTLSESFVFSFEHITWIKALKYFGFTVLTFILMMIAGLILALFTMLLTMIPVVGVIVQYIIQILAGGYFAAIGAALLLGLYYHATGELKQTPKDDNEELILNE